MKSRERLSLLVLTVSLGVGATAAHAAPAEMGSSPALSPPGNSPPQPNIWLSDEDRELLERGEIADHFQIAGGLTSLMVGFGIGQAVEGRWHDTGWIFTLGESASAVVMLSGVVEVIKNCDFSFDEPSPASPGCNRGGSLMTGALISLGALRLWEVIDAFAGPAVHNARVRAERQRIGPSTAHAVAPYVASLPSGSSGTVAGLTLRF